MPSILSAFEYDIFISYRHNDNRSGWVTEFVNALQEELASTIKEPLFIYFDKSPNDGLLETHSVDKSLEGKLKCLIFIPIISQTYCDPKSFAWQHEFSAFNKLAKEDQFGRDIKLSSGNVASRILPVKIHELDAEDKTFVENEIGGVLRPIEFIYKEAGVNRPLKSTDSKSDNQNKTDYRNQVNKVANAIKEIVIAIKHPKAVSEALHVQATATNARRNKMRFALAVVLLLIGAIGYFLYSIFYLTYPSTNTTDKSIAVLPFVNMSNDPEQEYFSDGISEELLNLLAKVPELKVVGRTSSFSFKGKNEDLRTIGQKLGATYLIEGSVRKSGNNIRITAQLIQAEDGTHVWSETYDRQMVNVFEVQDEIGSKVVQQLKLKIPGLAKTYVSKNPEAYNLLLQAQYINSQGNAGSYEKVFSLLKQAIAMDSTDARLWAGLARAYVTWDGNYIERRQKAEKGIAAAEKALSLDENLAEAHDALGNIYKAFYWDWEKAKEEYRLASQLGSQYPGKADLPDVFGDFEKSLKDDKSNLVLDPLNPWAWRAVGESLIDVKKFDEAITYYQKSLELSPHFRTALVELAYLYLQQGKTDQAIAELDKVGDRSYNRALFGYAWAYWLKGERLKSDSCLQVLIKSDDHPVDNSAAIARTYARRREADLAFKWLQVQYDRRHPAMIYLKSLTSLKELNESRYNEFLKKMRLPLD